MTSGADSGPNFLLDWHESADSHRYWRAAVGTLVVHAGIFALVIFLASLSGPALRNGTEIVPDFKQAVHLILPQDLTQKAPNKGKVAKEVNVEDLKPRPRIPGAAASRARGTSVQTAESATTRSAAARSAAHCRASENRDARYGTECTAGAARVGRYAESSANANSARGAAQARV